MPGAATRRTSVSVVMRAFAVRPVMRMATADLQQKLAFAKFLRQYDRIAFDDETRRGGMAAVLNHDNVVARVGFEFASEVL